MSKSFIFIVLVLLFGAATYFLGKKNANNQITSTVVQNVNLVQQIAELSALSVQGSTSAKLTNNSGSSGMWDKFKNYLTENTLQVTLPYEAKYGVQLQDKKVTVDAKDKTVIIHLPKCKLLSLQLQLDKLEMMNQTGLFASTTINDLGVAQKQLYEQAQASLANNVGYIKQAELQITNILKNYYEPLGYSVQCVFDDNSTTTKPKG
ncbi:MAG: DUF4230 domain-containing protein [Chitinophagaceae bacterium]|nr:DUF4230 domain-containing protein [Chitinophagaceae bacterium]